MEIQNLVLSANEIFSPPLDQVTAPQLTKPTENGTITGAKSEISSQLISVENGDPLGAHNLNGEKPSSSIGLTRNPSMKKKLEVNFTMFINDDNSKADTTVDSTNVGSSVENPPKNSETILQDEESHDSWEPSLPLSVNIDLKVIEPYKKVISHGGHLRPSISNGNGLESSTSSAVILFAAYYLPDRSRPDYHHVMENLFLYVVNTLHNMVADDYILIYLHNPGNSSSTSSVNNMPTFSWLKKCYQMIDRKLKKNLKGLYLVHPTFWLKTLIIMSKPFISSKFSRKLKFVRSLDELKQLLPIEDLQIPEIVKK